MRARGKNQNGGGLGTRLMGTSLTPSQTSVQIFRCVHLGTLWVEHLQDGIFMHELLHVTMSYCLDIAGIVAYRTALAVLLLLSDGILCIGKHHTNRQVSHLVHWIIPTFHWFLTSSVDFSVGPSLNGSRVFCYSLYV